jgi:hypothetical protein
MFDKRALAEKELKPLVNKLIDICDRNNIPMVFTACIASNVIVVSHIEGQNGWMPPQYDIVLALLESDEGGMAGPSLN